MDPVWCTPWTEPDNYDDFEKHIDIERIAPGEGKLEIAAWKEPVQLPALKRIFFHMIYTQPKSHNLILKISKLDSKITQYTQNHENFNSHRKI